MSGSASSSGRGHTYLKCFHCDKEMHIGCMLDGNKLSNQIMKHVSQKGLWEPGDSIIINDESFVQIRVTRI